MTDTPTVNSTLMHKRVVRQKLILSLHVQSICLVRKNAVIFELWWQIKFCRIYNDNDVLHFFWLFWLVGGVNTADEKVDWLNEWMSEWITVFVVQPQLDRVCQLFRSVLRNFENSKTLTPIEPNSPNKHNLLQSIFHYCQLWNQIGTKIPLFLLNFYHSDYSCLF